MGNVTRPAAGVSVRLKVALGAAGVTASLALLFFFDPVGAWFYPRCLFHTVTGLYCPGCGSLRALHALVHGHPVQAFTFNPPLFVGGLVTAYLLGRPRRRPGASSFLGRPAVAWGIPALVIVYWVARNLPQYPFTLLAPH